MHLVGVGRGPDCLPLEEYKHASRLTEFKRKEL